MAAKSKVYLETSFVGYLTSGLSNDIIVAAHQKLTRRWWRRRGDYRVYVSMAVEQEIATGAKHLASRRLRAIGGVPSLEITRDAEELAQRLVHKGPIPKKAELDALHIALAMFHDMDYLLTWNCKHIANAAIQQKLREICERAGYKMPVICTPEQLMPE